MAFSCHTATLTVLLLLSILANFSFAARPISEPAQNPMSFQYHHGPLLNGKISINLIWYGSFKPTQRAIVSDFITSLQSPPKSESQPAVAAWWASVSKYHTLAHPQIPSSLSISLGKQVFHESNSLGKTLTTKQIAALASNAEDINSISVVLTAANVTVEGFCMSTCGSHGSSYVSRKARVTYIWVGNSETQCPGQCAWPFHQPVYGPQSPPLVAPNNDVGLDGMVINLASLLAGTVTNPFGNGYFQGPKEAPLEAASACPGVYGRGAYPGYAGELLVDPNSGASYNANGVDGRKYLLPALYDPTTSTCSTLV